MLIGSPARTAFSTFQALNKSKSQGPEAHDRARRRAAKHVEFMVGMYKEQMEDGHDKGWRH